MWSFLKRTNKSASKTTKISLYWHDDHLLFMTGNETAEKKILVNLADSLPYTAPTLTHTLRAPIKKDDLEHSATNIIIPSNHFQLVTLDALPVSDEEINAALRWRLKDLIDYPVDQATWDYFQIPTHDYRKYILNVVVTKKAWLMEIVTLLQDSFLDIKNIIIPMFSLRNLLLHHPNINEGVGLLYEDNGLKLIIVKEQDLYLLRQFDFTYNQLVINDQLNTEKAEDLALFLQRSFDYYQSQLHQPPLTQLITTTMHTQIRDYLSKNLTCKVSLIDPNLWLDTNSVIKTLNDEQLIGLGGLY